MTLTRRAAISGLGAAILAGSAPRSAWARTEADVVVIGGGLAGLNAARMFEAAGLRVVIVEGENRIGGRLHTLDDLPGRPEAGGIQIGAGYRRLDSIASELGVGLLASGGAGVGAVESGGSAFRINGATVTAAEWPDHPANRLTGAERALLPSAIQGHYGRRLPPLTSVGAWREADARAALDRSYREMLAGLGASEEALRLIEANLNGNRLAEMSALHVARTAAIYRSQPGPIRTIAGGSQRLPEAMAQRLRSSMRLRTRVTGLAADAGGVTVRAGEHTMRARFALCTIPFAALRGIALDAPLPDTIPRLVVALPYTRAVFAYLAASEPFWESDGLGTTLWTDELLLGRVFVLGRDPAILKVWTTGASADRLDRAPEGEAGDAIVAALAEARPASRGKVRFLRRFSWQANPHARGIYHHLAPGLGGPLADLVAAPGQGRLFFAGEHLAPTMSGMEGALESGEVAALAILAAA